MTRPLHQLEFSGEDTSSERRATRSTARAFAAAISALLVSTLVVTRSDAALDYEGTVSGAAASSGRISLADDDQGRSLFDLDNLAPGRPSQRCVEISYEGTIVPVSLSLVADAQGDLGPYLDTVIEAGTGGGFESCDSFERSSVVFSGTLAELAAAGRLDLGTMFNVGERRSFRIRFELADENEALGRSASTGFVWEVRPS